jgi:hypothetical protein
MRLVRVGDESSQVGADVRAALASWGRGADLVGGVALIGCRPGDSPHPVDAVVVLPRGVIVVVGIDLPDPAVRLDAPLSGQWKTDGWPLVRPDGQVNPAVEALETVAVITKHLESARVEPMPVSTVVAVGPYVDQVHQPTSDLLRGVRILHPEPKTLLTAAKELAVQQRPCTVEQASGILAALEPDSTMLASIDLAAEGFADTTAPDIGSASTTLIPRVTATAGTAGRDTPRPRRSNQLRWLPAGAAVLVALLLLTGIVYAVASAGGSDDDAGGNGATKGEAAGVTIDGTRFTSKGTDTDDDCAAHAYGDVQVWLQRNTCVELVRMRYETTVDGDKIAVLVALLRFQQSGQATELRKLADQPGSGAIADASVEGTAWPGGEKPFFESAAYLSGREGTSVKLVQVVWIGKPSSPDDRTLRATASDALKIPAPN